MIAKGIIYGETSNESVLSFIDRVSYDRWWFIYKLKKIIGSDQCFPLILQRLVVGDSEFQWSLDVALMDISWSLLFKELMLLEDATVFGVVSFVRVGTES